MFKPTPLPLTADSEMEKKLRRFLQDKVRGIRDGLKEIHSNRVTRWRKNYEGIPAEATREFPFHNASNLIVPIIAIHSDTLLARCMSSIIKTQPPWHTKIVAGFANLALTGQPLDGLGAALEQFLSYVAFEPTELDLLRVYQEWFGETIRYGTSVVKTPWIRDIEDYVIPAGDGTGSFEWASRTRYQGPRPEKLRFIDFGIAPSDKTVEASNFMYHKIAMQRETLEERSFTGIYDKKAVAKLLAGSPDRTSPDQVQASSEMDSGAHSPSGSYGFGEWDIYECWFRYRLSSGTGDGKGHYVRCVVWYHERSDTILRGFFDDYPDRPFVAARLFYRDDAFHGYGFCEMLEPSADELSRMHNYRLDNQLVSNTRAWRVDPDSKLHEGYRIFPSAMLPAAAGEIEPLQMGDVNAGSLDSEKLSLELAEKRSGVSAPTQGMGSGFNTKRGQYTAMGTLSLLQEGNTRTDLNITDMRYAHTKLGRLLCSEYARFGIGDERQQAFGELSQKIEAALDAMDKKKLILPVAASSASLNREVEKQNDILISGLMMRHYQTITQMMMTAMNPMIPQEAKDYTLKAIKAADTLMQITLKHFNFDEVERLVPEPVAAPAQPGGQGPTPGPGGPASPGGRGPALPLAGLQQQGSGLPTGPVQ